MKTAILIHGHHLHAEGWEDVVWGDPRKGVLGHVPKGLIEALQWDADVIFFGTGASKKDGLKEGEHTLRFTWQRIGEIPQFASMGTEAAEAWLDARAVLELTSQDTVSEIGVCADIARKCGIERLVLVSSPTHIMRAHRTALSLIAKDDAVRSFAHALYAVASDVPYAGATVDDVLIIEPPHRPDRPTVFFNKTLKPLEDIKRRSDLAHDLDVDLRTVIEKYRSRL